MENSNAHSCICTWAAAWRVPSVCRTAYPNPLPYAHEIKSLTSEDYSDLSFLKPLLKDKTVVSLGENFHRVGEYASMKTRLVKYLHEELGFEVIAFESGLAEASVVNDVADELTAAEMMDNSIFDVWKSAETLSCSTTSNNRARRTSLYSWPDMICSIPPHCLQ